MELLGMRMEGHGLSMENSLKGFDSIVTMMRRIVTIVRNDQDNHLVHLCIFLEAFLMTLDQVRHPFLKFQKEIEQGLWAWHKIEGDRKCSSLLKVGKPQSGPCKLPLYVSIILYRETQLFSLETGLSAYSNCGAR